MIYFYRSSEIYIKTTIMYIPEKVQLSTHPLPELLEVAELPAQPLLVLYCHFSASSSDVTYYGYTTEIVPMCISKALVMFWSVIFSVPHSRVETKTTPFH
jgi:hypothetical protein